jgi:hypothetical protein
VARYVAPNVRAAVGSVRPDGLKRQKGPSVEPGPFMMTPASLITRLPRSPRAG